MQNLLSSLPYILGLFAFVAATYLVLPRLMLGIVTGIVWLLRQLSGPPGAAHRPRVRVDDGAIVYVPASTSIRHMPISSLRTVSIVTDASGPFYPDVWWVLTDENAQSMAIPLGTDGQDDMLHAFQALPDFDNGSVILAMSCTEVGHFPCWRASGGTDALASSATE